MLPPLTYKGSMLTSVKHEQQNVDVPTTFTSVKHEQKNVDVPTASDFAASFNFKHQANLDADSLSPYFASLNQVPFVLNKKKKKGLYCAFYVLSWACQFFFSNFDVGVIASVICPMLLVAYR